MNPLSRFPLLVIFAAVIIIIGFGSIFTVPQQTQAIVLKFGAPQRTISDPGLHMKWPLLENVVYYDKRVLEVDPLPQQVVLSDQKRLDVDAYARYQIVDPLKFLRSVNNEQGALNRMTAIVNSSVRDVLGRYSLDKLLSAERDNIMTQMRQNVASEVENFGIYIVEVRLRRADLPPETSQAVYNRMRSERETEAAEARSQGQKQSLQIRSRADRDKAVLLAESERQAQIIRGEGDAEAIRIYADSFGKESEFYKFYRTMQAYRETLANPETNLILSTDSGFLQMMENIGRK